MNGSQAATTKAVRQTRKEIAGLRRDIRKTNALLEDILVALEDPDE